MQMGLLIPFFPLNRIPHYTQTSQSGFACDLLVETSLLV